MTIEEQAIQFVENMREEKAHIIIAIDGRCASGKTTLAARLQKKYQCNVLHMDDFFLRPEQRTNERLMTPGGNVDIERFTQQVMTPLCAGEAFTYQAFDCRTQKLIQMDTVFPHAINIVEGSYSCHPAISKSYDRSIFISVSPKVQMERIMERNTAEQVKRFREEWIPMEERYFQTYQIKEQCHLCLDTSLY